MSAQSIPWHTLSEAYAFLGNSMLAPMSQTSSVGLDPEFWRAFPDFGDNAVAGALEGCAYYAEDAAKRAEEGANIVQDASVEYTKLFIGPPSPAAAPWETMYRSDTNVGFGEATFQMKALLKQAGLEVKNENHQYEDHMGIELLYLSELCRRRGMQEQPEEPREGDAAGAEFDFSSDGAVFTFIEAHPLSWIDEFHDRIAKTYPAGYFAHLTKLAAALLRCHVAQLVK